MQHALLFVVLIGLTVFLTEMGNLLQKVQTWEVLWNPPTIGQVLLAMAGALGAVAAALKIDVARYLKRRPPAE
jgi:hypothetical protein